MALCDLFFFFSFGVLSSEVCIDVRMLNGTKLRSTIPTIIGQLTALTLM